MKPLRLRLLSAALAAACLASAPLRAADTVEPPPAPELPLGLTEKKPDQGTYVETEHGYMVPYSATLPGTEVVFTMVPIPGGTFVMGSPEDEEGRSEDEGPQRTIEVPPFWMAQHEVTWAEYKTFMGLYTVFKTLKREGVRPITDENLPHAISVPTPLYEPEYTYEFGDDPRQPAVTMTQYSAKQYSKWLSGMTGLQYRLPTEAEWEYAARGGSQTAYSFGDDASKAAEYAAYADNSEDGPQQVRSFEPNKFGLYDMHGNAWEWVIDAYDPAGYPAAPEDKTLSLWEAVNWPEEAYPRTVRGGGFQETADRLRSAARMGSHDEDWKGSDPNFPKSPWWFTDDPARSVGMRLVRSLEPLPPETIDKFWNESNEDILMDVESRLEEQRGVLGLPVPELADDIKAGR